MRPICKNCEHSNMCEGERLCYIHLKFVKDKDWCEQFANDKYFDPTKLVCFTIVAVFIAVVLSKIL